MGDLSRLLKYLLVVGLLTGCAAGHCLGSKRAPVANADVHIFVFKPEGSKQCQPTTGIPIDKAAEDLGKIEIFSRSTRADGKMHITLCGAATGRIHVFEIRAGDLAVATGTGFQVLEQKLDKSAK